MCISSAKGKVYFEDLNPEVVFWLRNSPHLSPPPSSITHRLSAFRRAEQEYTATGETWPQLPPENGAECFGKSRRVSGHLTGFFFSPPPDDEKKPRTGHCVMQTRVQELTSCSLEVMVSTCSTVVAPRFILAAFASNCASTRTITRF